MIGIVAIGTNGAIGLNNALPWHDKEDLKFFRDVTKGHHVIMGNNTYKSLNKAYLSDRHLIVLTKDVPKDAAYITKFDGASITFASSIDWIASGALFDKHRDVFVAGGLSIYRLFKDKINTWIISYIDYIGNYDTSFDFSLLDGFELDHTQGNKQLLKRK